MIQDLGKQWRRYKKCLPKPRRTKEQTEMNNTLEGINRITEAEGWINDLKDRMVGITAAEQNREKNKK